MAYTTSFYSILINLVLLLARTLRSSGTATTSPRLPKPYPESFTISFHTNITTNSHGRDGVDYDPVTGTLYYDWTRQRQRIDHGPGSYECVHFYHTHHACSLIFLAQGMYRITHSNSANGRPCCLDLESVGTPPPDWARRANPTFDGLVDDAYSDRQAYQWTFDHLNPPNQFISGHRRAKSTSAYHTSRQVASWQDENDDDETEFVDLVFSFPGKANGTQDYHYQIETLVLGPPDPFLFQLPEGCDSILCDKSTS